jgi:hypothetical protein
VCPLSPFLFNIVLEYPIIAIRHEEEIKGIQIEKKEVNQSLFSDNMMIVLQDLEKLHHKTPRHLKQLQQTEEYRINLQKSLTFLYINNEQTEIEYRKTIPFTTALK